MILASCSGCGTSSTAPEQVTRDPQRNGGVDQLSTTASELRDGVKIVDVAHHSPQLVDGDVEILIDALASAPDDESAAARVGEAAEPILVLGPAAFPMLAKHFDDDRYSFTRQTPSGPMRDSSVGGACGLIMEWELETYKKVGVYPRMEPSYFREIVGYKNWSDWWSRHHDKSLMEIQIEATRWAIDWQNELLSKWRKEVSDDDDRLQDLRKIVSGNESQLAWQIKTRVALRIQSATPFYGKLD